jgi:hypothetical protein
MNQNESKKMNSKGEGSPKSAAHVEVEGTEQRTNTSVSKPFPSEAARRKEMDERKHENKTG